MNDLYRWLAVAADALRESVAKFAVVGGLAVSVHGQPRATHDVDVVLAVSSDDEAERICGHFLRRGFRLARELDQTHHQRIATMRFIPPGVHFDDDLDNPLLVDLIFASCGIEAEVVKAAIVMPIAPGVEVPVAQPAHLIAMKTLSSSEHRPKDLADLQSLLRVATDDHLDTARWLVWLIVERGYHNDRDLPAELEAHIRRWRGGKR